jgi:hypothetical protein
MERRRALHMVEIDCLCTAHVHFPIRRCSTTTRILKVERTVMRSEESRLSKCLGNVSILASIVVGIDPEEWAAVVRPYAVLSVLLATVGDD